MQRIAGATIKPYPMKGGKLRIFLILLQIRPMKKEFSNPCS